MEIPQYVKRGHGYLGGFLLLLFISRLFFSCRSFELKLQCSRSCLPHPHWFPYYRVPFIISNFSTWD